MLQTVIPFICVYGCSCPGPSVPHPDGHPQLWQCKTTPEGPTMQWITDYLLPQPLLSLRYPWQGPSGAEGKIAAPVAG